MSLGDAEQDDEAIAGLIAERPVVGGLIPAVVVRTGAEEATVVARSGLRYRLGMEGIRWARTAEVTPKSPRDVLKIGDVVYVLPTDKGQAWLAQLPQVQGAFVALDPHDGSIVALVGGFDYDASKFNRVTQARRQPGSSFKPFVYSAALEAGLTPASVILDAPVVYEAASLSSQMIAWATSSAVPARPTGMSGASRAARSGTPVLAWMSVSITPGRTALTRTPSVAMMRRLACEC